MDVLPQVMLGGVLFEIANVSFSGQEVGLVLWQSEIREGREVFGGNQLCNMCKFQEDQQA